VLRESGIMEDSEILELQLGMIKAIEALGKTIGSTPSPNVKSFSFWGNQASATNTDESTLFPKSVMKTEEKENGHPNSFSQPSVCLKMDNNFKEDRSWELRSAVKQKDFVNKAPIFDFIFSDWINVEGKDKKELKKMEYYGNIKNSFFGINEATKGRTDLFYLVINIRIVNQRQSVAIFACERKTWNDFLQENYKDYTFEGATNSEKGQEGLRDALKSCLKVKAKFWTIPTCGSFKNPFVFNNILDNDSYSLQLYNDRVEVFIDQSGVKLPWLIKPMWQFVVNLCSGITCNLQSFDLAYFLEAGEGDQHKHLFNYPERLLCVIRTEKVEWNSARII